MPFPRLFIAIGFFLSNCVFAYSLETHIWAERQRNKPRSFSRASSALARLMPHVPKMAPLRSGRPTLNKNHWTRLNAFGSVRHVLQPSTPSNSKVIVHIQDIHRNIEAQRNMSQALHWLMTDQSLDLMAVEGAFEALDVTRFRSFPHQDVIREAADSLLATREISGPYHAALTHPTPIPPVIGIDDEVFYNQHVQAVQTAIPQRAAIQKKVTRWKHDLLSRKKTTWNWDLQEFDSHVQRYWDNDIPIGDHLSFLSSYGPISSVQAELFLETLALESSLQFSRVEKERNQVLNKLTPKLSPLKIYPSSHNG